MNSKRIWAVMLVYVCLLAGRDVSTELFLAGADPITVAFYICVVIFGLSALLLLVRGGFPALLDKLRDRQTLSLAITSGGLTTVIYSVTFYLIPSERLGAALFNFLDFGLAPFCIAGAGILFGSARPTRELPFALGLYVFGMMALYWQPVSESGKGPERLPLMILALLSPIAMGVSDWLSRRFLTDHDFKQLEVLVVRFFMPTVVLGVYLAVAGRSLLPQKLFASTLIGVCLAFLPLYLLYTVLNEIDLPYLGIWEMLIPVVILFGTLHNNEHLQTPWTFLGAALILAGYLVYDRKLLTRYYESASGRVQIETAQ